MLERLYCVPSTADGDMSPVNLSEYIFFLSNIDEITSRILPLIIPARTKNREENSSSMTFCPQLCYNLFHRNCCVIDGWNFSRLLPVSLKGRKAYEEDSTNCFFDYRIRNDSAVLYYIKRCII